MWKIFVLDFDEAIRIQVDPLKSRLLKKSLVRNYSVSAHASKSSDRGFFSIGKHARSETQM